MCTADFSLSRCVRPKNWDYRIKANTLVQEAIAFPYFEAAAKVTCPALVINGGRSAVFFDQIGYEGTKQFAAAIEGLGQVYFMCTRVFVCVCDHVPVPCGCTKSTGPLLIDWYRTRTESTSNDRVCGRLFLAC